MLARDQRLLRRMKLRMMPAMTASRIANRIPRRAMDRSDRRR
jgi:hypothetical protein